VDQDIENIFDDRYVRALSHPLRMRIMAMLGERTSSPARLAAVLNLRTNVVAYHVKLLHELGIAELVSVRRGRGGEEHFYAVRRHPTFSDEAWEALAPEDRAQVLTALLRQIGAYVSRAALAGGFERPEVHMSRTPIRVDEEGWRALSGTARDCLRAVAAIEREVAERGSQQLFDAGFVVLLFEAKPFSDEPAQRRGRKRDAGASRERNRVL
jgi:DNA-binding transcriptional ArsR family regulator